VLELIAQKTGAVIVVPPGSGLDRIVEHTGPGPANDVLERLLNGSPFDFIIVSSPQRPHDPAEVLLTVREAETPASGPSPDQANRAVAQTFVAKPWTPPPPMAPVVPSVRFERPKEPIPRDVLEQMMKERIRQLRGPEPEQQ
jgi:hypothetical protein